MKKTRANTSPHQSTTPAHRSGKPISKEELKALQKKYKNVLSPSERKRLLLSTVQKNLLRAGMIAVIKDGELVVSAPDADPQWDINEHPDEYRDSGPNHNQDGDEDRMSVASPERTDWNKQSVLIHAQMVKKMGAKNIATGAKAGGVFNIQYELNGRSWRTSLLMA